MFSSKAVYPLPRIEVVVGENFSIFFKVIKILFIIDSGARIVEKFDAAVHFNVENNFFDIFPSKSTLVRLNFPSKVHSNQFLPPFLHSTS